MDGHVPRVPDDSMTPMQFRIAMMDYVSKFDTWAWIDYRDATSEYDNYKFEDWFRLFKDFIND